MPVSSVAANDQARAPRFKRWLAIHLVVIVAWAAIVSRFQEGDVYVATGAFAMLIIAMILAARTRRVMQWVRPSWTQVAWGVGIGVTMTLLTYPVYGLACRIVPELNDMVRALYVGANATAMSIALPWTLAIIVAEELLWRGSLIEVLERRLPRRWALLVSVASYALAQWGTGSPIVALMALTCGTVWTIQRVYSESLVAPLIAHLIWTPTVIFFFPVI